MDNKALLKLTQYCVITFPNTNSAIMAEKVLNDALSTVAFVLMPVPTAIAAGCGLAIKTAPNNEDQLVEVLVEQGVTIQGVYLVDKAVNSVTSLR